MIKKLNKISKDQELSNSTPIHKKKLINKKFSDKVKEEETEFSNKQISEISNCKAMLISKCSDEEITSREEQNLLNRFEIDKNSSYFDESFNRYVMKAKKDFCLKVHVRSAADQKMNRPETIRTELALINSVEYILNNIIDVDKDLNLFEKNFFIFNEEKELLTNVKKKNSFKDNLFCEVALFIEDRFRAVRQDFTILENKKSIIEFKINLIIARFLVMCINQCLDYEKFTGHQAMIKLFKDQLNKTLSSLRESMEMIENLPSKEKEEVIFYSCVVNAKEQIDVIGILNKFSSVVNSNSNKMKLMLNFIKVLSSKDFLKFFKLLKNSYYLEACVFSLYLFEFRKTGFIQLSSNQIKIPKRNISFSYLKDLMLFESDKELESYLTFFTIEPGTNIELKFNDEIGFENTDLTEIVKLKNKRFIEAKRGAISRKKICLEDIKLEELKDYLSNTKKCLKEHEYLHKNDEVNLVDSNIKKEKLIELKSIPCIKTDNKLVSSITFPINNSINTKEVNANEKLMNELVEEKKPEVPVLFKNISFNPSSEHSLFVKKPSSINNFNINSVDNKIENNLFNIPLNHKENEESKSVLENKINPLNLFKLTSKIEDKSSVEEKISEKSEKSVKKEIETKILIEENIKLPKLDPLEIYHSKLLPKLNSNYKKKYIPIIISTSVIKSYQESKLTKHISRKFKLLRYKLFFIIKNRIEELKSQNEILKCSLASIPFSKANDITLYESNKDFKFYYDHSTIDDLIEKNIICSFETYCKNQILMFIDKIEEKIDHNLLNNSNFKQRTVIFGEKEVKI